MILKGYKCDLVGPSDFFDEVLDNCFKRLLTDSEIQKSSQLGRLPIGKLKENDDKNLILAIVKKLSTTEENEFYGRISLENIDYINRSAELKVFLTKDAQGKGIAYEACKLIMEHGFGQLNLHRIYAGALETNKGFIKLASKFCFRMEGRRVQAVWKNNEYVDVFEYAILRSDFYGLYLSM